MSHDARKSVLRAASVCTLLPCLGLVFFLLGLENWSTNRASIQATTIVDNQDIVRPLQISGTAEERPIHLLLGDIAGDDDEAVDAACIQKIRDLPSSNEKRVISYGLYGDNPKYTQGAIRNAELAPIYFPGWTTRFYADDSVPWPIIDRLRALNAEIVHVDSDSISGSIAGMFWRFTVADDPSVDRFIVRDSDSRPNARDRFAVEEWIYSRKSTHSIRDHPGHNYPMSGGLWGSTRGAIQNITGMIQSWTTRDGYLDDMNFLNSVVWPLIAEDQISHDSYFCEVYGNAHPFPTRRYANLQHVGQVFDAEENSNEHHIELLRAQKAPNKCRKSTDWIYG